MYFCAISASSPLSVTVTPDFDENELPEMREGRITKTFSFTLSWNTAGLVDNKYYTIEVPLTSSRYKGTAANHGSSTETDLYFDGEDNAKWTVLENNMKLQYKHTSQTQLSDLPTQITVRCRDWGAHGEIDVTINGISAKVQSSRVSTK